MDMAVKLVISKFWKSKEKLGITKNNLSKYDSFSLTSTKLHST